MGGTGMAVVADIGRASEGNGAVLRPNILLNRHTHPAHPGSGRLVSSPSWAPACKLQTPYLTSTLAIPGGHGSAVARGAFEAAEQASGRLARPRRETPPCTCPPASPPSS